MIKIKDIVGYEGLYKVDSEGNVYNKNGLMTANQVVNGYKRIALSKGNKSRKHLCMTNTGEAAKPQWRTFILSWRQRRLYHEKKYLIFGGYWRKVEEG